MPLSERKGKLNQKNMKNKKVYDEFVEKNSSLKSSKNFLVGVYCWIMFNPLVYPLLLLFFRKKIIAHVCNIFVNRMSVLWSFIAWISCNSGASNRYWFHYYTKMKYAPVHMQVWMICETKNEEDLCQMYSDEYVDDQVKCFCLWENPKLSEKFKIHMLNNGFLPRFEEFKFAVENNYCAAVKEMVKQTISDEWCVAFWERAIENDGQEILSVFVDYVIREGLTPRMTTYVMQSHECIAKKAISKALETHRAISFIKRSKPNEVFRELLIKGVKLPYEAQCFLTLPLYKIYKGCRYELSEKAIIYHLQKEGEMAKEILNEQRDFTSDVMNIIASSQKLSSWYRNRV